MRTFKGTNPRLHNKLGFRKKSVVAVAIAASIICVRPAAATEEARLERLSDWLLRHDKYLESYALATLWLVPEEIPAQLSLKLELIDFLSKDAVTTGLTGDAKSRIAEFISLLPVTGRVPVSSGDARWLEAHPSRNPLLLPGQSVRLVGRPTTVTVIGGNGIICRATFVPNQEANTYVRSCFAGESVDWVWVVQPDGRTDRWGIANWNEHEQDFPAPGSWIWAPPSGAVISEKFSEKFVRFLATQGAAPDSKAERRNIPQAEADGTGFPGGRATGLTLSSVILEAMQAGAQKNEKDRLPSKRVDTSILTERRSRNLPLTSNDWGGVGLLQTPSARFREPGTLSVHLGRVDPYTRYNIVTQPFKWMEAGLRYVAITDRLYGPVSFSGTQSAKDKGLDFKFSLMDESRYVPAVAIGFRDVAGTGLFSGEYLVASKRFGSIDASLGLGWGNLADSVRDAGSIEGGNFRFSNYFSKQAKPFGGIQWETQWESLILKAEYEGKRYLSEPSGLPIPSKSQWNFGATYRVNRWVDFSIGIERGNRLMTGLTLNSDLAKLSTPKLSDPAPVPVVRTKPIKNPDWGKTAQAVSEQTGWQVNQISKQGDSLAVTLEGAGGANWRYRIDRAVGVLHRDSPADINRFVLRYEGQGLKMAEQVIDRDAWLAPRVAPVPSSLQREAMFARDVQAASDAKHQNKPEFENLRGPLDTKFRIGYGQVLGGPDGFVLYQIYAEQSAKLRLGNDSTWLTGAVRGRLIDNFDKYRITGPSNLPRVRTFLREYNTTSEVTIPYLQASHVRKLSDNQYASAYAGYLEEMFAGFGGEWLYRPFASRLAFGVDANAVQQRGFRQDFTMLAPAYRVFTGHATLYWDTGWNGVQVNLSAGQYLARDRGATIEMSRAFSNGVVVGAFATKTNVSAQQFGEGSFDKGLFLSIPFDAITTRSTNTFGSFLWRPLTRDGGARLAKQVQLYGLTQTRDLRIYQSKAPPIPEAQIPADRASRFVREEMTVAPVTSVAAKESVADWKQGDAQTIRLQEALSRQGYRGVEVRVDDAYRVNLQISNDAIRPISKAVGRAVRTVLNLSPADAREIRVQFRDDIRPLVEYEFFDLNRLGAFFAGQLSESSLKDFVLVRYVDPAVSEKSPLALLDDMSDVPVNPQLRDVIAKPTSPKRVVNDFYMATETAKDVDWSKAIFYGGAAVLGSSTLDRRAFDFANSHQNSKWLKGLNSVGDALPWLGLAGAGLLALDGSDPRRSATGYASAEAGVTAALAATGLKYAFGRARPNSGLGRNDYRPGSRASGRDSFPSRHTAMSWALATPFALEYNAPWLYGLAAVTNLSRVGKREHWFSDTVGGGLLGYGIGRLFWESSRNNRSLPQVLVAPDGVNFSWTFK